LLKYLSSLSLQISSILPGFHKQKCNATTLKGTLKAIAEHDAYRERQSAQDALLTLNTEEAKLMLKKERNREIYRTLSLIDELKACKKL